VNGQDKILSLYAYIVVDDDNTEGVPAVNLHGVAMPLVGADLAAMTALRPMAQTVADQTGRNVQLAHFSVRTNGEVLKPNEALKAFRRA
jgi:hypothetical protein